jgi:hypothetical protein
MSVCMYACIYIHTYIHSARKQRRCTTRSEGGRGRRRQRSSFTLPSPSGPRRATLTGTKVLAYWYKKYLLSSRFTFGSSNSYAFHKKEYTRKTIYIYIYIYIHIHIHLEADEVDVDNEAVFLVERVARRQVELQLCYHLLYGSGFRV